MLKVVCGKYYEYINIGKKESLDREFSPQKATAGIRRLRPI
jgi:hypothetical protein